MGFRRGNEPHPLFSSEETPNRAFFCHPDEEGGRHGTTFSCKASICGSEESRWCFHSEGPHTGLHSLSGCQTFYAPLYFLEEEPEQEDHGFLLILQLGKIPRRTAELRRHKGSRYSWPQEASSTDCDVL